MDNVQVALLLRQAVKVNGVTSKTVTLTANGSVNFAFGAGNDWVLQFTHDQWNEIVQFVESQLDEVGDKAQPSWGPDWSQVDEEFNYWAVDSGGRSWAYANKPKIDTTCEEWVPMDRNDLNYERLGWVPLPNGVSWKNSLCTRPTVSPK